LKWIIESLTDFLQAIWEGDLGKIAFLVAATIIFGLCLWISWLNYARFARKFGLPLRGDIPEDKWSPPSSEEVRRVIDPGDRSDTPAK
jgi:hypothetical protein